MILICNFWNIILIHKEIMNAAPKSCDPGTCYLINKKGIDKKELRKEIIKCINIGMENLY